MKHCNSGSDSFISNASLFDIEKECQYFISNAFFDIQKECQQLVKQLNAKLVNLQKKEDIKLWELQALEQRNAKKKQWREWENVAQEACLQGITNVPLKEIFGENALTTLEKMEDNLNVLSKNRPETYESGKLFVSPPLFGVDVSDIQEILKNWDDKLFDVSKILHRKSICYLPNSIDKKENKSIHYFLEKINSFVFKTSVEPEIITVVQKIVEPLQKAQLEDQWEIFVWTQECSDWNKANKKMVQNLQEIQSSLLHSCKPIHMIALIDMGKKLLALQEKLLDVQELEPDIDQWKKKMTTWRKRQDAWNEKIPQRMHEMLNLKDPKIEELFKYLQKNYPKNWFEKVMKEFGIINSNAASLINKWEEEDEVAWQQEEWVTERANKLIRDLETRLQEMEEEDWSNKILTRRDAKREKWVLQENELQDVCFCSVFSKINAMTKNANEIDSKLSNEIHLELVMLDNFVYSSYENTNLFLTWYPYCFFPNTEEPYIRKTLKGFLGKMKALEIELQKLYQQVTLCHAPDACTENTAEKVMCRSHMYTALNSAKRIIKRLENPALIQRIRTFIYPKPIDMNVHEIIKLMRGASNWQQVIEKVCQQLKQNPTEGKVGIGKTLLNVQKLEPDMKKWCQLRLDLLQN